MIKILQIVPSLSINNGMMSVVVNYHRNIDRTKVQFDYIYFYENPFNHKAEIHLLGGKTYCIGTPKPTLTYFKNIEDFFNEHENEYVAIHCHPIFASEIFANAAKRHGIKHVIAHSHSTRYSNKRLSAIRNYIINLFVEYFATDYMACSKEAAKLFGSAIKNKDVYILNNAINCNDFRFDMKLRQKVRSSLRIDDREIVLGHVGRFTNEKNHIFLIDVFNEYKKLDANSKLLFVGDGPLMKKIKVKVESLKLTESVIFTGRRSDVNAVLAAMDMFVLPSLFEGVPVSVIEAQASGLPCVISNNITKEVGVTNSLYLSLSLPASEWASKLKSLRGNTQRVDEKKEIYKSIYEITSEANKLTDYYTTLK